MNDSQIFDLETKNSQTFKKMSSVWLWFSETCFKNIKKNWKHKKGRTKKFKKTGNSRVENRFRILRFGHLKLPNILKLTTKNAEVLGMTAKQKL